jgi:hypothetical protein
MDKSTINGHFQMVIFNSYVKLPEGILLQQTAPKVDVWSLGCVTVDAFSTSISDFTVDFMRI